MPEFLTHPIPSSSSSTVLATETEKQFDTRTTDANWDSAATCNIILS